MPVYEHRCIECEYEWEDIFKLNDPIPEECPECHAKGKVERLISWCRGKVELSGRELTQQLWAEGKQLARQAQKDENLAADIIGHDKYHQGELAQSKK